jgi:hypothetical protein
MTTMFHPRRRVQIPSEAGRGLARIADHATDIAEDVVYLKEGAIIRHERAGSCGAGMSSSPRGRTP